MIFSVVVETSVVLRSLTLYKLIGLEKPKKNI